MKVGNRMILFIILIAMLALITIGCSSEVSNLKDIDYEIISKDDFSVGGAVRLSIDVVVSQEVSGEELELISKEVVSEVKKDIALNAISINFYDHKEYAGHGYTLGQAIYAPNGKWEDANTTSAGNYRYMDYDFKFRSKDWSNRLTKEEVNIFKGWKDLLSNDITEEDASKQISEQFNISESDVDDIIMKQIMWAMEDN